MPEYIVIIATKNRPEKLKRALRSVQDQVLAPNTVIVVDDSDQAYLEPTRTAVEHFNTVLQISRVINPNNGLSSAINTGLRYASDSYTQPSQQYICLLDDDDWWSPAYLTEINTRIKETNADWVIPGLRRYDENFPDGRDLRIPETINKADFYVTNPNIQGSNLVVRMSYLLEINGFDEQLVSTTDRDVCISLLDTDISYTTLDKHLVHHWAFDDEPRLSTPGNPLKQQGLKQFYDKYRDDMTLHQLDQFKSRALNLFGVRLIDK